MSGHEEGHIDDINGNRTERGPERAILIVDDDAAVRETFVDILALSGYVCFPADSGEEALEILRNNPIDVILLDIKMPEMDGISTYRHIREMGVTAPVIVVSALSGSPEAKELLSLGASCIVAKPPDIGQVLEQIMRLV